MSLFCPPRGGPAEQSEGEEGEPQVVKTSPPFRPRLRRCHLPPKEGERNSFSVLLGEDRLSLARES